MESQVYEDDDTKIVMEQVTQSQRVYHISSSFDCALTAMIATEQKLEEIKRNTPQETLDLIKQGGMEGNLLKYAEFLATQEHKCPVGEKINALMIDGCDIDHGIDMLVININLAKTSWQAVHRTVVRLICEHFGWEAAEVIEV